MTALPQARSQARTQARTQVGKPSVSAGELNPYYFDLNDLDMGDAPFTRDVTPGMAVCGPIENLSYLPLDYVSLIVMFGGDVEGLRVIFRFSDPEADCPLDPTKTWNEWGKGSNPRTEPVQYGEHWYRTNEDDSQSTNSGQAINASAWVPLMLAGQLTVISVADYQAVVQANQPE